MRDQFELASMLAKRPAERFSILIKPELDETDYQLRAKQEFAFFSDQRFREI
jgi:hypothetical protein